MEEEWVKYHGKTAELVFKVFKYFKLQYVRRAAKFQERTHQRLNEPEA